LLNVLGPGGVGKSRLALEAGRGLLQRFADGVYLVNLSPLTSPEAILPSVAEALGLRIQAQKSPLVQIQDYLRQKELLLLLDGCEAMLDGIPLVLKLLSAAPDLKVLATSRVRLRVEEEQVFQLGGLAYPSPGDIEAASFPAVRLYASGARRARPGFELNPQYLPDICQICAEVQGMPLAILLAAAWAEVLSPAEILAEMRTSPDFLQAEWADLPPRQRSVWATFDYSWNMLDKDEQAVFRALCVFRGGFTYQAAVQVGGATPQQLRLLVDKSFLAPQASGWYDIHALLRQFGLERLSQTPAAGLEAHRRYSTYFLDKLEGWEADIKGANQKEALAEMDAKINDLRPAWEWSAEQGDLDSLVDGLEALCLYHELRARATEGKRLIQETAARVAQHPDAKRLMAFLAAWESRFCRLLGELPLARQRLNDAQVLLNGMPGPDWAAQQVEALVHREYGEHVFTADLAAAQEHLQRSLALYCQLKDAWHMAGVLNRLGDNQHLAGDYAESDRLSGEALELYQELGTAAGIASAQRTIVQTQFRLGNIERALALMEQVIAFSQASGDRAQAVLDLRTQGLLLVFPGRYEQAISLLSKALLLAQGLGDRREIAFVQLAFGMALFMNGQYKPARSALGKSLKLGRSDGFQRMVAASLWSQGCIALVESSPSDAKTLFQESLDMYRQVGHQDELSWAISLEAYCHILSGQLEQARQRLVEALQIANSIRGYFSALVALAVSALWLGAQGQAEKALQVYTLVAEQPVFAHSAWFHQVFDKNILAFTKELSGEVAEAAQERGRQRQLWLTLAELLPVIKKQQDKPDSRSGHEEDGN
jgi:predicted ATPase